MSKKSTLHSKRKQSICIKLDQLKIESDIAISHIKKIFDEGSKLVSELERADKNTFLHRYPQVNKELDKLVGKVIQFNYHLEISSSSDDDSEEAGQLQLNQALENAVVVPVLARNVIKENLPLIQSNSFHHFTIPCDVQVGDILDMCYVHGDSPCNFWLRHYSTKVLEEVTEFLISRFNGGHLRSCENVSVGMHLCVCDGQQFFRAKVLEILEKQPVEVLVLNVDKGEIKEVTMKNIFHLDEEIQFVRVQCINCCLQGNLGDISLWNYEASKLFSQILRDSNLVVTVIAKIPGEPNKFMVEIDCHHEGRVISKIELSKWLTSEVFPLLYQIEQNSLPAETLRVLYRCLDLVQIEEAAAQCPSLHDVSSLQQSSILEVSTDVINNLANEIEELSLAASNTCVSLPQVSDFPSSLEPFIRPLSADSSLFSRNVALKSRRLSLECHDNISKSVSDNKENKGNDSGPSDCLPLHLEKCKFTLSHRVLDEQIYDAMIAHIENPGEFYIHIVCAENTEIDHLARQMNEFYGRVNIPLQSKSEAREYIGSYCAAYSISYKGWFRAQIMDWNENDDKLLYVKFVDYGDEQSVPLEAIQPLRHEFTEHPIFTQRCHLSKIHPIDSVPEKLQMTWTIESINLFKCLVDMNALYTVKVSEVDQSTSSLSILLYDNSNVICINKSMVDYGYAVNFSPFEGPLDIGFRERAGEASASTENQQSDVSLSKGHSQPSELEGRIDAIPSNTENKQVELSLNSELVPVSEAAAMKPVLLENSKVTNALDFWDPMSEDFYSEKNNLYHDDEDATYVVTGYKPQDEKRVCKFFATTGKCYKGQTCLKEHTFLNRDGWTTDKEKVFYEAFSRPILPQEGSEITLEITEIVNANTFWAIIRDDFTSENCKKGEDDADHQEETLQTLNNFLNQDCNVRALRMLEIMPALGQIVVAKYADGHFYRARVVDHEEENSISVVYVDYGNKAWVKLSDIRGIEQNYLHLPFQAVECVLANVEHISDDLEGASIFHNLLHGVKFVYAKVVNSFVFSSKMEVLAIDGDGYDLGTQIIESGHGTARTYRTLSGNTEFFSG